MKRYHYYKKIYKDLNYKTYSVEDDLPKNIKQAITKRFPESYNQMNARLASNLAREQGVSDADIAKALLTFPGVPGRMEVITDKPVRVIVDFAHTPQGIEAVLTELRKQQPKNKKLIAVLASRYVIEEKDLSWEN
jgi:UDP-N-acetylmuramyl tripeptide synthase